jgi:hypothetical protein
MEGLLLLLLLLLGHHPPRRRHSPTAAGCYASLTAGGCATRSGLMARGANRRGCEAAAEVPEAAAPLRVLGHCATAELPAQARPPPPPPRHPLLALVALTLAGQRLLRRGMTPGRTSRACTTSSRRCSPRCACARLNASSRAGSGRGGGGRCRCHRHGSCVPHDSLAGWLAGPPQKSASSCCGSRTSCEASCHSSSSSSSSRVPQPQRRLGPAASFRP